MEEALAKRGRWEDAYEWRIGTEGRELLELLGQGRFRVRNEDHGLFEAEFEDFAEALEALGTFRTIQHDLFYSVGWSSWAGRGRLRSEDPPADLEPVEAELAYLLRLSEDAREEAEGLRIDVESALERQESWHESVQLGRVTVARRVRTEQALALAVSCRSMTMSAQSPTVERALEFAGIYSRLQDDLAHHLEWTWI